MLGTDDKQRLLDIARTAVVEAARGVEDRGSAVGEFLGQLAEPGRCFVTLRIADGSLRGCIGTVDADQPLALAVDRMSRAAATMDPRFLPIQPAELDGLQISITVLSQPERTVPEAVEVGRHGVIVSQGERHGLLLPQVATEQGWDREEFLRQTCRKAGLPPDSWMSPETVIEVFTGDIFET